MKKLLSIAIAAALIGCGPADVPKYEDILPNETAFVVPMEGASKSDQGKFGSVGFLEESKVATKRIYIPRIRVSTGRLWYDYSWLETVKVIKVNRAPINLTWEGIDVIKVESKDSIGFGVGIVATAKILEEDTAKFLYNYPSGNLLSVLSGVFKIKATESLSNKFALYDLEGSTDGKGNVVAEGARQQKGIVVEQTKAELVSYFKSTGVTVTAFGLVGGLSYEEPEIQKAINDNFKSELEIKNAENQRLEQEKINAKDVSIATAAKDQADQFALAAVARTKQVNLEIAKMNAEANLERAKRWDGKLPTDLMMLPAESDPGFILNMNKK